MPYIDFAELKSSVGIEAVLAMLDIRLKKFGDQLRGRCPIHGGGNDREFVVTPRKGLYYCFGGCGGGDSIKLVARIKGCELKEAAAFIAARSGFGQGSRPPSGREASPPPATVDGSPQPQPQERRALRPLDYLQYTEAVAALGVAEDTCRHFGAGYAPKGIMRGRFAIPIHDRDGTLLAYCGRTVKDESPTLTFPNGFDPASVIFNADRATAGELTLVRDPLSVLAAYEAGIDNVVAFLTESISAEQLEQLAALMDERRCDTVALF